MVRNYKRKKEGPSWTKETLLKAVEAVKHNKISGYEAAKTYNIPRTTIMDHVIGRRGQKSLTLGRPTALPPDTEKQLADSLHTMEKWGFGLSREEVIDLVSQYIILNKIPTPFKGGVPGSDWFANFASRNSLSIKKPQAVEYARKKAADPFIIDDYFNLLDKTIKSLGLENRPDRIWNLDETSYCSDPKKTKVVGLKGFASTRTTSSSGKNNTTVLFASSAAGEKGPPFIIFKGKYLWSEWTSSEGFPGTTYTATKNGWIESEAFEKFMSKSFIPMIKNKDEPSLLIYDGHSTHIQLSVIKKAKENNITIIKLPPHSSHLLQPLDLSVFKPFKDEWDKRMVKWQRTHVGQHLPKKDFSVIVGQVWKDMDSQIIKNGFKKAGIYPFNRNCIPENGYDPDALKKWKTSSESTILHSAPTARTAELKNPSTLNSLCLHKINALWISQKQKFHKRCCENNISFESLLLKTVKRDNDKEIVKRRKVKVSGNAEVLTHENVIAALKLKEEENNKKEREKVTKTEKRKQAIKLKEERIKSKKPKQKINIDETAIINKEKINIDKITTERKVTIGNLDNSEASSSKTNKINILENKTLQPKEKLSLQDYRLYLRKGKEIELHENMTEKNNKLKLRKVKRNRKVKYSSSECSGDYYSTRETDASDEENMDDYLKNYLETNLDNEENLDPNDLSFVLADIQYDDTGSNNELKEDDWVLVKFCTKKSTKHYVGKVLSTKNNNPTIKYVRKFHTKTKESVFTYPNVDDIHELKHVSDIVTILPQPKILRRGQVLFKISFEGYNIQ